MTGVEGLTGGQGARIAVVGVGGGGCNAVEAMQARGVTGVTFLALNTDAQALARSGLHNRFQLGRDLTRGLGAGADPEVGRAAALADREAIAELVRGQDLVFLAVGLGGGTGTGAAPIVAEVCREAGAITVGLATLPFGFEGRRRARTADDGSRRLAEQVDTLVTLPNERLLALVDPRTALAKAFAIVDDTLGRAVASVSTLVQGAGQVNVDFADVRTILGHRGRALLGVGTATGAHRAVEATQAAISSPLLQEQRLAGARHVLLNIQGPADLPLLEIAEAASLVADEADEDVNLIWGWVPVEGGSGEVCVTLLATGFDDELAGRTLMPERTWAVQGQPARHRTTSSRPKSPDDGYDVPTFFRWPDPS